MFFLTHYKDSTMDATTADGDVAVSKRRSEASECRSIGTCCVPFVRSFAASVRSPTLNVEGAMSVVCCVVSDVVLPSPASLVVMATTKFSIIHE